MACWRRCSVRASISGVLFIRLLDPLHARGEEGLLANELDHAETLLALQDEVVAAVGRVDVAQDVGDRAGAMQVECRRLGNFRVPLHQHADRALLAQSLLGSKDRGIAANRQRKHGAWEQDQVARGKDDEAVVGQGGCGGSGLAAGLGLGCAKNTIATEHGYPRAHAILRRLKIRQPCWALRWTDA